MSRIPNLSEETIMNILSRVPAKCVGQCRCLSKRWQDLLSRPEFIRAHLNQSKDPGHKSLCFISHAQGTLYYAPLVLSNSQIKFREVTIFPRELSFAGYSWAYVHASYDGLLLVSDKEWRKYIVNPITREIKKIPREPYDSLGHSGLCHLVYNSATEDYGVVTFCFGHDGTESLLFVCIFCFKTGTWKKVQCSLEYRRYRFTHSGVFANGYIHCVVSRCHDNKVAILGFDVMRETFHEVLLPSMWREPHELHHLSVFDGCLCVLSSLLYEVSSQFWVMKEYGVQESWTMFATYCKEVNCVIRNVVPLDRELVVAGSTTIKTNPNVVLLTQDRMGSIHMEFPLDAWDLEYTRRRGRKIFLDNLKQRSYVNFMFEFEGGSKNLNFWMCFVDSLVSPLAICKP